MAFGMRKLFFILKEIEKRISYIKKGSLKEDSPKGFRMEAQVVGEVKAPQAEDP